jgi:hypothetical protein
MKIDELKSWLVKQVKQVKDNEQRAHFFFALSQIKTFEEDPKDLRLTKPLDLPAGPPIGGYGCDFE